MQLAIQIRPAATDAEVSEAVTLLRPPDFWVKYLVANWYALAIAVIVIVLDINAVIQGKPVRIGPTLGLLVFVAAALLYSWFRWVGKVSKTLRNAVAHIQDLSVDIDGIRIVTITGAVTAVPWSSYESWLEGKSIFLLKGKDGAVILPVDESNRDMLRSLLESRVH